jgi:hypothetical protein
MAGIFISTVILSISNFIKINKNRNQKWGEGEKKSSYPGLRIQVVINMFPDP